MTPFIQAFASPKTGLTTSYECPLIRNSMLNVYETGCSRMVPYALNITLLLWAQALFASVSTCMGLAFVRR